MEKIKEQLEKDIFFNKYEIIVENTFIKFKIQNNKYKKVTICTDFIIKDKIYLVFTDQKNNINHIITNLNEMCTELKKIIKDNWTKSSIKRNDDGTAIVFLQNEKDIKLVEEVLFPEKISKLVEKVKNELLNLDYGLKEIENEKVKKIICSDFDFMSIRLKNYGFNIKHASDEIKDNEDMVFIALTNCELELIDYNLFCTPINYASDRIKNNKIFARKALNYYGLCLTDFSDEIKDDKEIVKLSIRQNPESFMFISSKLKNDKEIIILAFQEGFNYINCLSKEYKKDRNFMFQLLKINILCFYDLDEYCYDDEEIMNYTISVDSQYLKYASDRLKDDWSFVKNIIQKDYSCMRYVSERISEYFFHKIKYAYDYRFKKEFPIFTLDNIPKPLE